MERLEIVQPTDWPHQKRGVLETIQAIEDGEENICFTAPTGAGKSLVMVRFLQYALAKSCPAAIMTTRKMLTDQLIGTLSKNDIGFGVVASGYKDYEDASQYVQICSTPTLNARVFNKRKTDSDYERQLKPLPEATLILWDEIHQQKAATCEKIWREYQSLGSINIGLTATPLGVSHLCKKLIVAGTNSELRQCGALVPAYVYAPDEPDLSKIKREATGEYSVNEIRKKIWTQKIFGRVLENWKRLNSERKPTILFAPGVEESVWFVDQFEKAGVRAAHIDGEDVYLDGESFKSTRSQRKQILDQVRTGDIEVVCNRFVMREGVDLPELYHLILATPIGSLLSYIQIVGRVLRAHPSLDHVVVQDHGGNWWRHGSPNADIDWEPYFNLPPRIATDSRLDRIREKKEDPGVTCIKCGAVQVMPKSGRCYSCNHDMRGKRKRVVLQHDGTLKVKEGLPVKQRYVSKREDTEKKWRQMYFRMKRAGKTFSQAMGLFFHENGYFPPRDLANMPLNDLDWFRRIDVIPDEDLTGKKQEQATLNF